jgi:hypothetical protein
MRNSETRTRKRHPKALSVTLLILILIGIGSIRNMPLHRPGDGLSSEYHGRERNVDECITFSALYIISFLNSNYFVVVSSCNTTYAYRHGNKLGMLFRLDGRQRWQKMDPSMTFTDTFVAVLDGSEICSSYAIELMGHPLLLLDPVGPFVVSLRYLSSCRFRPPLRTLSLFRKILL